MQLLLSEITSARLASSPLEPLSPLPYADTLGGMPTPQRIASLLAGSTEILYALGLGERVVAISHECDYPAEVNSKPRVTLAHVDADANSKAIDDQVRTMMSSGQALYGIDASMLAALQPELIVTQAQCDVCAVRYEDVLHVVQSEPALRQTQVVAINPQCLNDILPDVQRVGQAAGCEAAASQLVTRLRARLERIRVETDRLSVEQRPRVACIEWLDPLMLAGNWVPELIEMAGGQNGLTRPGTHSPYVSWKQIVEFEPQVILVAPCGFPLPRAVVDAEPLRHLPGWSQLPAVRNGQVFAIDGNAYLNRSGPRIIDTVEILAHLLHPQRFDSPDALRQQPPAWQRLDRLI